MVGEANAALSELVTVSLEELKLRPEVPAEARQASDSERGETRAEPGL